MEMVFKFKPKVISISLFSIGILVFPILLSRPSLYLSPYLLFLFIPIIIFLSTFSKKIVLTDTKIMQISNFKIFDRIIRWERISEANACYLKNLSTGTDFERMCQPFSVVRYFASRSNHHVLKLHLDGSDPLIIVPSEIERYKELYDFINTKITIKKY